MGKPSQKEENFRSDGLVRVKGVPLSRIHSDLLIAEEMEERRRTEEGDFEDEEGQSNYGD